MGDRTLSFCLEITVSFLEILKWELDIYTGFSPAHLQCWFFYTSSWFWEGTGIWILLSRMRSCDWSSGFGKAKNLGATIVSYCSIECHIDPKNYFTLDPNGGLHLRSLLCQTREAWWAPTKSSSFLLLSSRVVQAPLPHRSAPLVEKLSSII